MHYCKEPLSHVLDLGRVEAPKELGEDRTQQSTAAARGNKENVLSRDQGDHEKGRTGS